MTKDISENRLKTLSRSRFLTLSLFLAAAFGSSFALIILGSTHPADPSPGRAELFWYALSLGAVSGPPLLLLTGLTCLWTAFFWAAVLGVASLAGFFSGAPDFPLPTALVTLAAGTTMAAILALSYGLVLRRVRELLGPSRPAHPWATGIALVSVVPLAGTILYWYLALAPAGRFGSPSAGMLKKLAVALVAAALLVISAPFVFRLAVDSDLLSGIFVQPDLEHALRNHDRVRTLNLATQDVGVLPPAIGKLTQLVSFNASYTQLRQLPVEIGRLQQLRDLYLSGNQLTTLPLQLFELGQLRQLWIERNRLVGLPPQIDGLENLTHLKLAGNALSVLPPEIGRLRQLQVLDVEDNQLTTLPPEIGQLSSLQTLNLMGNPLTELPEELGQLTGLRQLGFDSPGIRPETRQRIRRLLPAAECFRTRSP